MNKIILALAVVLLFVAFIPDQGYRNEMMRIHKVRDSVYVVTSYKDLEGKPFPSNSVYLITAEGIVFIDTPWGETATKQLLDSISKRHGNVALHSCIVTHFHDDRTSGLDVMRKRKIKTYSSAMTKAYCIKKNEKIPQFSFASDTVFQFGKLKLETFYPGKGHSPDNIVVYLNNYSILIGGCFVKSTEAVSLGNTGDANLAEWPLGISAVLKKYKAATTIIPGHQSWVGNGLKHTLKLLKKATR